MNQTLSLPKIEVEQDINPLVYDFSTDPEELEYSEARRSLQQIFLNSAWLTTKYLCGFDDAAVKRREISFPMRAHVHGALLEAVQKRPWRRLLVMMPRKYGKSSALSVGFAVWLVLNNPNIRIGLATGNYEIGKAFLDKQKAILKSPLVTAIFPDIAPLLRDAATSFTVNRTRKGGEPTVTLFTEGTNTEGFHFDFIFGNDLVNRKNYKSRTKRESTKQFAENFTNLSDPGVETPILYEGTPWHVDDLYAALQKKENVTTIKLPLYDLNGNSTFPEEFDEKRIAEIKADLSDKMFTTQYYLNPISEEDAFMSSEELWQDIFYDEIKDKDGNVVARQTDKPGEKFDAPILATIATMDPAGRGDNMAADCVIQKDTEGNYFLRYGKLVKKWKSSEAQAELEFIDKEWNPRHFGIENQGQLELDYVLPEDFVLGKSKIAGKLEGIHDNREGAKDGRIGGIEAVLRRRKFFIYRHINPLFVKQIKFYPEWDQDAGPDVAGWNLTMFNAHRIYAKRERDKKFKKARYKPRQTRLFRGALNG